MCGGLGPNAAFHGGRRDQLHQSLLTGNMGGEMTVRSEPQRVVFISWGVYRAGSSSCGHSGRSPFCFSSSCLSRLLLSVTFQLKYDLQELQGTRPPATLYRGWEQRTAPVGQGLLPTCPSAFIRQGRSFPAPHPQAL